jgi:hypothetical protein
VHFYYDEDPKGEWVQVEVMIGTGHTVAELKKNRHTVLEPHDWR